jgi:hypothetical protein
MLVMPAVKVRLSAIGVIISPFLVTTAVVGVRVEWTMVASPAVIAAGFSYIEVMPHLDILGLPVVNTIDKSLPLDALGLSMSLVPVKSSTLIAEMMVSSREEAVRAVSIRSFTPSNSTPGSPFWRLVR